MISSLVIRAKMTVETSVFYCHLTWTIAHEDFTEFSRRESYRSSNRLIIFERRALRIYLNLRSLRKSRNKNLRNSKSSFNIRLIKSTWIREIGHVARMD
jgi:hypothetical protein